MIRKNKSSIKSISDWETHGKPKSASHWVPERSAFEVAREWLDVTSPTLPSGVLELLKTNSAFGDIASWTAEPEAQIRIDKFRGEPRNCDLLVKCTDPFGAFVIAVEAKADEPFGDTVDDTMSAALERLAANPASKGVERIANLCRSLFGARQGSQAKIGTLRYQLLTATAGAVAASTDGPRTVMLVQEFITGKTTPEKHEANRKDLDAFVHRLTNGAIDHCEAGTLYGPIALPARAGQEPMHGPQLFIGKLVHDRTKITADEAVRTAMRTMGGERTVDEVANWMGQHLTQRWEDVGKTMADMTTSNSSHQRPLLERVEAGKYRLKV